MSNPVILFSTVYPADLHSRMSLMNTRLLLKEWWRSEKWESEMRVLAGSAHQDSALRMQQVVQNIPVEGSVKHYNFKPDKNINTVWMHEIAWVKRELMKDCLEEEFDILLYADSDIEIDLSHIYRYMEKLDKDDKKTAVQLPYCIRGKRVAPSGQMGAFMIRKKHLGRGILDYIYSTKREGGKIHRWMAPDCGIKKWFIKNRIKVIRASDIKTVHWNEDGGWVYDSGRCSGPEDRR